MKSRWLLGLALLVAALSLGRVSAGPEEEKAAREELQAWYGQIVDAYERHDLPAYMELFAPDFKSRDARGKIIDRKAWEAFAKNDMAATGAIHSAEFKIKDLTLKDNEASIVSTETWKAVYKDLKGEYGPKGKAYDVVWSGTSRGKAVKTPHGWEAKYREAMGPEQFTSGGKPLVPLAERKKKR